MPSAGIRATREGVAGLTMLGDISLLQILLVGGVAFLASLIGGVTGYGTGLLLPPVLITVLDPSMIVPVVSLSALVTNASRLAAFRSDFAPATALRVALLALPGSVVGALFYTRLSGPGVAVLIGAVLIVLVPLRRILKRRHGTLGPGAASWASAGYGVINGGTSGSGVLLLTILLATGLGGSAVIATDAGISLILGLAKTLVFQSAGSLPPVGWLMAGLIGACAAPGAFLARRLAARLSDVSHTAILDAVVILGGAVLVWQGARAAW